MTHSKSGFPLSMFKLPELIFRYAHAFLENFISDLFAVSSQPLLMFSARCSYIEYSNNDDTIMDGITFLIKNK